MITIASYPHPQHPLGSIGHAAALYWAVLAVDVTVWAYVAWLVG